MLSIFLVNLIFGKGEVYIFKNMKEFIMPKSFQEMHDELFKEHEENYKNFTKFILSLSVAFITFTTAQISSVSDGLHYLYKIGLALQALSLLFGIWLQYILLKLPLEDLNKVATVFQKSEKIQQGGTEYFSRPPSWLQRFCFNMEVGCFTFAFVVVVISVLINVD